MPFWTVVGHAGMSAPTRADAESVMGGIDVSTDRVRTARGDTGARRTGGGAAG